MDYFCATNLEEICAYLCGAQTVAFDFETSPMEEWRDHPRAALDAHMAQIVGISLSVSEGMGCYIPLRHRAGNNVADPSTIMAYLRTALFENSHIVKIAHNLAFEAMFLYAQGIVLQPPCYDTIAAAQLTLKTRYRFRALADCGLKKLAAELLGEPLPTFEEVTQGRHFDLLDAQDPETLRYACADADFALRLHALFNGWFDRYLPRHRFVVEAVESPTAVYTGIMKYNGVPIDAEIMREKQVVAEMEIVALREKIAGIIGDVPIGANASTSAFKRYLFKELGLPVLKTTAKFQEAADDETMIRLTDWCRENRPELVQLFELVQAYRKWGKISSTYIAGYLEHASPATNRLHPDLLPLGTDTGRFASRRPNLQNSPRKDNDPVGVRSFIRAPEGKLLLSLDFSQIELRVGAFYCRDPKMLATYREGGDIHAQTTSVIYGISMEEAADKNVPQYKERRTIAKNANFGVFYGLFPSGLQRTLKFKAGLDTSLSACESIIHNLLTGYPGLARWQEEIKEHARQRLNVATWAGRRRYLPDIVSEDWGKRSFAERCAMNTPVQGTAADILKLALGRIVTGLPQRPWLRPLLQIHDELVFEIPEERLTEAVSFVKACMEAQPFEDFDVPIVAESAYGSNFGDMREMEG